MTTYYGRDAQLILIGNCEEYEHIAEGEQRKFNHQDCDAGADTKFRLYVKMIDGAYLFHCHNCGNSGYYRPKENFSAINDLPENRTILVSRRSPSYESLTDETEYDKFRIEGQLWLGQHGFDEELTDAYGIVETRGGLVLPVYADNDMKHKIVGCQIRKYSGTPKYTTYSTQEYSYLAVACNVGNKPLVITEDLLSSYKLHSVGHPTLCLLGTKMHHKILDWLSKQHKRQVLWLDDDLAGHRASIKLLKEFSPLLPELTAIFYHKQPKEIDIETLKTMVI